MVLVPAAQLTQSVLPRDDEYLPEGHLMQEVDALLELYEPALQGVQPVARSTEVSPAAQSMHEVLSGLTYVPAVHDIQLPAPMAEYWPMEHTRHVTAPVPPEYLPAGHLSQLSEPASDIVPAGHEVHTRLLASLEYLPGVQAQHFDVLQEDVPAPHAEHFVKPATAAMYPLAHAVQDPPPLEPWYLPEGQAVHDVAPPVEYLPAVHELHDPPVPALPAGQAAQPVVEEAY
jgi:hypothetical protein